MAVPTSAQLIAALMPTFRAELASRAAALDDGLRRFEDKPEDEGRRSLLNDLAREAHALKGASRSVQERTVEKACERLERALGGKSGAGAGAVQDEEAISILRDTISVLRDAEARLGRA